MQSDRHEKGLRRLGGGGRQYSARRSVLRRLFLFRSKRGDYLKILYWDGSGLCLFAKRLEKDRFVWPRPAVVRLKLSPAQLGLLIEGIDWRRTVAPEPPKQPAAI